MGWARHNANTAVPRLEAPSAPRARGPRSHNNTVCTTRESRLCRGSVGRASNVRVPMTSTQQHVSATGQDMPGGPTISFQRRCRPPDRHAWSPTATAWNTGAPPFSPMTTAVQGQYGSGFAGHHPQQSPAQRIYVHLSQPRSAKPGPSERVFLEAANALMYAQR